MKSMTAVSIMICWGAAADIAVLRLVKLDWLGFVPAMDDRRFRCALVLQQRRC
jgi:hypothetical protein